MRKLGILLLMATLLTLATLAQAMDVTLQWDANTDYGLVGYKIYSTTTESGEYDTPVVIVLADDQNTDPALFEYTVTGLSNTRTRFVVTAYDATTESGYSNEVNTGLTPPGNLLLSAIDNIIAGLQDIKAYLAQR